MTSVGDSSDTYREPGDGPLGRITGAIYWYLVVTLLIIATTVPGLVLLMFLDRSAGNAPLVALCLVPVGPALSAALYSLRDRETAEGLTPARSFLRGYRLNTVDVLKLWVPALVVLAVIGLSLGNLDQAGVPDGYGAVLVVIGALIVLWSLNALVIASFFSFRTRDVARLAAHFLARLPLVTLGAASLLIFAAGIVYITFDVVLLMLSGIWAALLLSNSRRLRRDVREQFVATE